MQRFFSIFCAFVLLAFLVGCGNGNVSLRGTVTFADTGEPLTQGTVSFLHSDGRQSRGTIQPDGTYVVGTETATDGLPPGTYRVVITGADKGIPPEGDTGGSYTWVPQIDRRYEDPATSELSVTVDASTRTFDIQVDRFTGAGGGR